mgnify:FL=1
MKGSFSVEAAFYVPLLVLILAFAMESGINLLTETKEMAEKIGQADDGSCVELFYTENRRLELGEIWHGN